MGYLRPDQFQDNLRVITMQTHHTISTSPPICIIMKAHSVSPASNLNASFAVKYTVKTKQYTWRSQNKSIIARFCKRKGPNVSTICFIISTSSSKSSKNILPLEPITAIELFSSLAFNIWSRRSSGSLFLHVCSFQNTIHACPIKGTATEEDKLLVGHEEMQTKRREEKY